MCCVRWSNEAATVHADIAADHRDVPANFVWHEAKPRTSPADLHATTSSCRFVARLFLLGPTSS